MAYLTHAEVGAASPPQDPSRVAMARALADFVDVDASSAGRGFESESDCGKDYEGSGQVLLYISGTNMSLT